MNNTENNKFFYNHARCEVSSDVVILGYEPDKEIHLLLVHKKFVDPEKDCVTEWALPGRFIRGANEQYGDGIGEDSWEYGDGVEDLETCVEKALTINVDVKLDDDDESVKLAVWECKMWDDSFKESLEYLPPRTFPRRDQRGKRVISLPVMVFVKMDKLSEFQEKVVRWVPVSKIMKDNPKGKKGNGEFVLPFDHADMFYDGIERLRQIVRVQPIGREILGKSFTINQLLKFYEAVFHGVIEKSGFRKWLLDDNRKLVEGTNEFDKTSSNRPAQYYRFNDETYNTLRVSKELGFNPTVTKKKKS